jgi:histidinol-phosphate aminotransferase
MKVSEEILKMIPYKPGKPIAETQREYGVKEVYKLASNENPLGISPKALLAIQNHLAQLNRYPDASCYELVRKVAKAWGFPPERITVGNGSDELIDLLVRVYCEPGDSIITSQAAFVAYSVRAAASRVKTIQIPMTHDFRTDLVGIAEFLRKQGQAQKTKIVFLPNPNNPTGTYIRDQEVVTFLNEFGNRDDLLIVFDEAYTEFVRAKDYKSAVDYVRQCNNVILLKTLSKIYGLAGLRVGIMVAPADTIDLCNRVRTPFNVNELAQVAAMAALDDFEFVKKTCEVTWRGLDYFYAELKKLALPYIESQGNFVLFDTLRDVKEVDIALLKKGVILRPVLNYGFKSHLRMSVGLDIENQIAIKALTEVMKEVPKKYDGAN